MKNVQKKTKLLITTVLIGVLLTSCGKAEPNPNSGVYEAVSATMMGMEIDISDVYENGVSFDLQDGGKCIANMDGETAKIKWSTEGDSIHIEGSGVKLDGTIGGGDMTLENMMDMGMDMKFHCDELLHSDIAGGDEGSSKGSVLKRLKDAKAGKNVYGSSSSDEGKEKKVAKNNDETSDETGSESESASSGSDMTNADYKSVTGETFSVDSMSVMVPDGWEAYEESGSSVRLMKGSSSKDDYFSKSSLLIEWHPNASGSIDTSNYSDVTDIELNFGDLVYKGQAGMIPGGWAAAMAIAEHGDGYILMSLTAPADDDSIQIPNADFQAVMASVKTN